MKNPIVVITVLILLFIAGGFLGKNWDKWFPSKPSMPADGTKCSIGGGTGITPPIDGIYQKGVCVPANGGGGVNPSGGSRVVNTDTQNPRDAFLQYVEKGNLSGSRVMNQDKLSKLRNALGNKPLPVTLPPSCIAWIYSQANDPNNGVLFKNCVADMGRV